MTKIAKIKKIAFSLTALCAAVVVGASTMTVARASVKEYFLFPDEIAKNTYLGMQTQIARVTPADEDAENYRYGVLFKETNELIETDGYSFLPEKEGTYKCVYSYEINGDKHEYTYEIVADVKDGPVFRAQPNFPYAFVSGSVYRLPQVEAYDYTGGGKKAATVQVAATIEGEPITVNDDAFTPVAEKVGDTVEIVYTATSGAKSEQVKTTVPVVHVYNEMNEVDMSGLFYQTGGQKTYANESCVGVRTTSDLEVQFANVLAAEGLEMRFGFGEKSEAEKITLTLESAADPSVALSLTFNKGKKAAEKGTVLLNGKAKKDYKFAEDGVIKVVLEEGKARFLREGNEVLFDIDTDLAGGEFKGFPSGLVKVAFQVENVYGTCDIEFYQINLQMISNAKYDYVQPALASENKSAETGIGEKYTIGNIRAVDVIDPSATVEVKITLLGKPVVGEIKDGTLTFIPEKAGAYAFKYTTTDRSYNSEDYTKIVYVRDEVNPELHLSKAPAESVTLNQKVKLPSATASDNGGGGGLTIALYVQTPTGEMRRIAKAQGDTLAETEYTFTDSGTYVVRYVVADEYENFSTVDYKVVCGG